MKTFFKILVVSLLMLSIEGVKGELHFSSLVAPEITAQVGIIEVNEDASVMLEVSQFTIIDLDNTTVFILTVLAGLNYTFDGNFITPATNWSGVLSVPVQVSDGELLSNIFNATITVNPLNDAPVITTQPGVIEVNEDVSVTLAVNQFTFSDVDHTTGFTLVVLSGSNYTFNGTIITTVANFTGVLSVPVQVSDGSALSNVFNATITVKPLNDAPVIAAQPGVIEVNEDASVTLDVNQFTFSDVDHTTGFTLVVLAGSNYTFSGTTITPASNFTGVLSVPVQVSDGSSLSNVFNATITVKPLNDAPVITAQPVVIEVDEDVGVTLAVNQFTISDVDHTTGFTLVVLSGSNYTFSGTTITPAVNFTGVLSVLVQVSDGSELSNVFNATITVKPLNDAPVITAQPGVIEVNEDASVMLAVNQFTISDVDHTTGFTLIVLSGTNYTFNGNTITPIANFTGVLSVPVQVSDGSALSNVFTASITVKPLNDTPVITAQPGVIEVNEDTSVTLAVSQFTISDVDQITGFTLVVSSSNNYTFSGTTITPVANFTGVLSVPVQVSDGSALSNVFTATITVKPLNDAPVITAQPDAIEVNEDASVTLAVNQFTISDVDHTTGFTLVVSSGNNYTFSGTTITPAANFTGVLSVPVQVSDGSALSNIFNASVTVKPLNDAPVITAQPDAIEVNEDASVTLAVNQFTISDVDHTTGFTLVVSSGNNYTFSGTTITPAANFTGVLSVPVQVSDGSALSNVFTASVTVKPINDAPLVVDDLFYTAENTSVNVSVLANDNDLADGVNGGINPSSLAITQQPQNGSCVVLANKNIIYTPYAGFFGVDHFVYRVADTGYPIPAIERSANVTIEVTRLSPLAIDDQVSTPEDSPVTIRLLDNDVDSDKNPASVRIVDNPQQGTLAASVGGVVVYTPVQDYFGNDRFTYTVKDFTNLTSNVANVNIVVTPVNDAPVAITTMVSTPERVAKEIPLSELIMDVDGNVVYETIVVVATTQHGSLNLDHPNEKMIYTPSEGFEGTDGFTFKVSDSNGLISNVASVSIVVSNQTPLVVNDQSTINEDRRILIDVALNDSDPQNNLNRNSVTLITAPLHGVASVDPEGGGIFYQPSLNYSGTDLFRYQICDHKGYCGQASVTITILPVNDLPEVGVDAVTTNEDVPVVIDVLLNDRDVDGQIVLSTLQIATPASNGQVEINRANGQLKYLPSENFSGTDYFKYEICDNSGGCSQGVVNISILPVNDAPQPHADQAYGYPMLPLVVDVIDNDVDVESELVVLSVVVVQQPAHGRATVNGSGQVVYTANDQFIGTDSFLYRICDKGGLCGEALVKISVSSGNHPPVVVNDQVSLHEDHSVWIAVLANDVDPENQLSPASLTMIEPPLHGLATVDVNTGRIHYEPDMDYYGSDRLVYKVCDNYFIPLCNSGEVLLTILPDNDVPVGGDDVFDASDGVEYRWNLLENDYDVDDVELIAQSLFLPDANVNATIDRPGWLSFKASLGYYCQTVRMRYKVCDDGGLCDTASLIVNVEALDSDADGIPDAMEGVEDADGDHIPNYLDNDSDGDGIDDSREASLDDMCVAMPIDTDNDAIPNYLDVDSDGDGVPDVVEGDEDCDGDRVVNYLDLLDDCQQRVLVPDTFSPNGDGINDAFVIPIVSEYPQNELLIFNRWGSIVFSELNYQNSWSGRSESGTMGTDQLPEGTYFYVLKLGVTGRMIKGTVYLKK